MIPMFAITGVIVSLFHQKQARLAQTWRSAGEVNLASGRAKVAIEDFRNALLYSPNSTSMQLELAQALAEQGQLDEAQTYLMSLRASDPENSLINVELARVAAVRGDVDATTAYYHDAMYGHWPNNPHDSRLAAREELIQFFLSHGRKDAARAESLSMAADNPADPDVRVQAGNYLLQTGDAQSALNEFQRVLRMEPENQGALTGSGEAALTLGRFSEAEHYLTRAIQRGTNDPVVARDREVAAMAADLDPYETPLNDTERRRRVLRLFGEATERAKSCFPAVLPGAKGPVSNDLKSLAAARAALPASLSQRDFKLHPEWEKAALTWVFDVEKTASERCGPGSPADVAISLIAGEHKEL
jgi:tetratricopeptide (TPR) repeat protein